MKEAIAFCMLVAIVCSFPAFILNRPTDARRLMWRVIVSVALAVQTGLNSRHEIHHAWRAFYFAASTFWWFMAIRWWRRAEVLRAERREFERKIDEARRAFINRKIR